LVVLEYRAWIRYLLSSANGGYSPITEESTAFEGGER